MTKETDNRFMRCFSFRVDDPFIDRVDIDAMTEHEARAELAVRSSVAKALDADLYHVEVHYNSVDG